MNAPESKKYDPRLDSLRAVSALAIIPFHYTVLPFGWIGVQIFFVLSGMFITESLLKSKNRIRNGSDYLLFFFEKRALRLFPLYYGLLLVLGLIYFLAGGARQFLGQAPFLFTYTSNLFAMFFPGSLIRGTAHLWSLGVEWQFYLVWPFLVWKLREKSLLRLAIVLVFLAPILREITLLVAGVSTKNPDALGTICYMAPWSHWDAIALGALLVHHPIRSFLSHKYCWIGVLTVGLSAGGLVIYLGRGLVQLAVWDIPITSHIFMSRSGATVSSTSWRPVSWL